MGSMSKDKTFLALSLLRDTCWLPENDSAVVTLDLHLLDEL
jgi:hypothetical protein